MSPAVKRLIFEITALLQAFGALAVVGWLVFGGFDHPDAKWWMLLAVVLLHGYMLDRHAADHVGLGRKQRSVKGGYRGSSGPIPKRPEGPAGGFNPTSDPHGADE